MGINDVNLEGYILLSRELTSLKAVLASKSAFDKIMNPVFYTKHLLLQTSDLVTTAHDTVMVCMRIAPSRLWYLKTW